MLEKLQNIEVVRYNLKSQDTSSLAKRHIGVIAEDSPDEITTEDKSAIEIGSYLGFLLAAIKSQNEEIKALKQQIDRLSGTR
ncbi:MAG: tail fiber domain-containing protein [Candidatus Omnitrophica bacterium]|nr:tail fiber domain-containing protein [Candidatus Omnitrophota bacterium]